MRDPLVISSGTPTLHLCQRDLLGGWLSTPSPICAASSRRKSLITRLLRRDAQCAPTATVPVAIHLHHVRQPISQRCSFPCDADHLRAEGAAAAHRPRPVRSSWSRIDYVGRDRR